MANTAFGHDATLTTPGSTTDTALVRWANTSGTSLNNTINILSDGSNITLNARGEVRFSDADSTHYIAFESPATVGTSYTMTLPADLPAADEVLTVTSYSGGAGVLEWAAAGGGAAQSPWTGNIDAANYQLLNVGNANSDWTAGVLTVAAANASTRLNFDSYQDTTDGGAIQFRHSRHDTLGSHTALVANDDLGKIRFYGSGGSAFSIGAIIQAKATETFSNGSSNFGTKLEFYTTDNTTDTNDLHMTIDQDGITTFNAGGNESIRLQHSSGITWSIQSTSASEFRLTDNNAGTTRVKITAGTSGEMFVKENASYPSVTKGIAKAWCKVASDGSLETPSYGAGSTGVSSVTRTSTGVYKIYWNPDFVDANYVVMTTKLNVDTGHPAVQHSRNTDYALLENANSSGTATDKEMMCVAFGEVE